MNATSSPSVAADNPRPKRRLLRRALKYTAATLAILVIAYAALCIWYYRQTPKLTRNYAAELNAETLNIPPEKRAWTHYRRALEILEPRQDNEFADTPSDKDWPTTEAYLKRNAKAIEMLRDAARIRPMGIVLQDGHDSADIPWKLRHREISAEEADNPRPSSENAVIAGLPFTHASINLSIARILQDDTRFAVSEGDGTRAVANIGALLDLAEQVNETPMLVNALIATTIAESSIAATLRNLAYVPSVFHDDDLIALTVRLEIAGGSSALIFDSRGERLNYDDMIQRHYTDDGNGEGVFTIDGDQGPENPNAPDDEEDDWETRLGEAWDRFRVPIYAAFVFPGRSELNAASDSYFSEVERILRLPNWQRAESVESFDDDIPFNSVYFEWIDDEKDSFGVAKALLHCDGHRKQRINAALVALAVIRHHRLRQQYPAALNELGPNLLREVPIDQFAGNPLLYKLIDNQPTIYSVGADLDDDGGRAPEFERDPHESGVGNFSRKNPPDGDWILFPPYKEPPLKDDANQDPNVQVLEDETEEPNAHDNEQVEPNKNLQVDKEQPEQ
jgi:hypothetical protein